MTPDQRLDRAERIILLMTKAGLRYRDRLKELDEKIAIIVDAQIKYEERVARNEERFAGNEERFASHEERFAGHEERLASYEERFAQLRQVTEVRFAELAEQQRRTDRKLEELIEIIRRDRNGELRG